LPSISNTTPLYLGGRFFVETLYNCICSTVHTVVINTSDQILSLCKSCHYHDIRQLRCIRLYLDSTTACSTATYVVHSKLDYCRLIPFVTFPKFLTKTHLQQILLSQLSCAVVKASKSSHTTPIVRCLYGIKITERVESRLLFLT